MACRRRPYADEEETRREARRLHIRDSLGLLAGQTIEHLEADYFPYRCRFCRGWHVHVDRQHLLTWRKEDEDHYFAKFGGGFFCLARTMAGWQASYGRRVWNLPDLFRAREWCEAVSYLPERRWP